MSSSLDHGNDPMPPQGGGSAPGDPAPQAESQRRLRPEIFIARRRARLERILMHPLVAPRSSGMPPDRRRFLLEEAQEVYWNELEWERNTSEEMAKGGSALVELAFPGFLAFIDGLLLREANARSTVPASPRPEVVEDLLLFLATRCLELLPALDGQSRLEREMTERLVDLVLYRLHRIPVDAAERLGLSRPLPEA
jgi:hypothetical protein